MEIKELLYNNRQTSGDFHATAGRSWRIHGESKLLHSPLIYSALEFRLAVERYIFEIYYFMVNDGIINDDSRSKSELLDIKKITSVLTLIYENSGNKLKLYRAFTFNRTFSKIMTPIHTKLSIPDIGIFHKYWSKLSEYCHRQINPTDTWDSKDW